MPMADVQTRLRAWTLVDELVLEVHSITRRLPEGEAGGVSCALRGAAIASALRVVRGVHGRGGEFEASLREALQDLIEVRYFLYLARRLGLIDLRRYRSAAARHEKVQKCFRDLLGAGPPSGDVAFPPTPPSAPDG